jgi:hypothetical protein
MLNSIYEVYIKSKLQLRMLAYLGNPFFFVGGKGRHVEAELL